MRRDILVKAWCIGLLAVILISMPAYGMVLPISFEDLVERSSHIVIGRVVDKTCQWAQQWTPGLLCLVYTYVTIAVDEYIKGESVGDSLVIRIWGGEIKIPVPDNPETFVPPPLQGVSEEILLQYWPVGTFTEMVRAAKEGGQDSLSLGFRVYESAEFEKGEKVLLFLEGGGSHFEGRPIFSPVGAFQGKYTIVRGKAVGYREEIPLDELLDRINKVMGGQMEVKQTSWGEVKFLFLLALLSFCMRSKEVMRGGQKVLTAITLSLLVINTTAWPFVIEYKRWHDSKIPIRYYIDENYVPDWAVQSIVKAFDTWTGVVGSYVSYEHTFNVWDKDIYVGWGPIDGPGNILALTTPYDSLGSYVDKVWYATIKFDEAENWDTSGSPDPGEIDLESVALHEVGHTIVLEDSSRSNVSEI